MWLTPELVVHGVEVFVLMGIIPLLRSVNKLITTYVSERENFPPHLHANGSILFPHGLNPKENMNVNINNSGSH